MINRLTNFNPVTVSSEPEPEVTPQPPPLPAGGLGIAEAQDGFVNVDQAINYSNLFAQEPMPLSKPEPPPATVDASEVFNFLSNDEAVAAQPPPPQPAEGGLGQTLEDFTENKIQTAYEQKTSKEFGPDPTRISTSDTETLGNTQMPENISSLGSGGGTTVGELKGSWNLAEFGKIDEKAEGEWGTAYAKGSTQVLGLSGEIYYKAGVDLENKTVTAGLGAKGSVEIIGAHYEAGYKTPPLNIGDEEVDINAQMNADAYVGFKGNAEANITLGAENSFKLGAGAFDGAHASIAGKVGVGDVADAHGYLAGWSGVGAKAEFGASLKGGKLDVDWGLGLSLGVGAEWDLGFTVDFSEIADTGLEGMREIGLDGAADWIENTTGDGISFAGDAANWTGEALEDIGDEVGDAADDVGDAVGDALDAAGDAAEDVGDALGDAAGDIGDALDDWF